MKNIEETFKQAMIMGLCGIAEYHKEKEIKWNKTSGVQMTRTIEFVDGSADNAYIRFYRKGGDLYTLARYVDKEINLYEVYNVFGQKLRKTEFVNGKRDKLTEWHDNGKLKVEKSYRKGRLHGTITEFKDNGARESVTEYRHGKIIKEEFYDYKDRLRQVKSHSYSRYGYGTISRTFYDKAGKVLPTSLKWWNIPDWKAK